MPSPPPDLMTPALALGERVGEITAAAALLLGPERRVGACMGRMRNNGVQERQAEASLAVVAWSSEPTVPVLRALVYMLKWAMLFFIFS